MTNLVTSLSSPSHALPATQEMPTPPTNRQRFSYMPPYAKVLPKVTPPIPSPQPATSTTALLSPRITSTPATKELRESAPTFEKLFPKIFAKHKGFELTQQHLLSQDDTEKNLATLVLIDYLSGPPTQGLMNEEAVSYFNDCIQLATSLNKMRLPPLQSETVGECLQDFLFQVFLTIDNRLYPQVTEFLNLNDGDGFEAAKERILAHCKKNSVPHTHENSFSDDEEAPLRANKRPCVESPPSQFSPSSNSPSFEQSLHLRDLISNVRGMPILTRSIDQFGIPALYKSYILDQFAKWTKRSNIRSKEFDDLWYKKRPDSNHKLFFRAYTHPTVFRRAALAGYFEAKPNDFPPPDEKSGFFKFKEEAYEIIKKQYPELVEKYPLRRNTWPDLPRDLPETEKVGINPFLQQNFVSVQTLLFQIGYEIRNTIAPGITFISKYGRDEELFSKFFNFLAYQIIRRSTSDINNTELSIKLQITSQKELIVYINHDTFDLAYGHFNHRLYPNEPNLIKLLLESVHQRWNCSVFDYPTWQKFLASAVEEDRAVCLLLRCLAEGIHHRYFAPRWSDFYRIFMLNNNPLTRLMTDVSIDHYSMPLYQW